MIIAFEKLLITLEHNDIFTSNKDYLTPSSQIIHLTPSMSNLVDKTEVEINFSRKQLYAMCQAQLGIKEQKAGKQRFEMFPCFFVQ